MARTGYTFLGWNTEADASGAMFRDSTAVLGNMTVYAIWAQTPYEVKYVVDGAAHGSANTYFYEDDVTVQAEPTLEGNTFSGWSVENTRPVAVGDIFEMPAENVTIYGSFAPNPYTVTYMVSNPEKSDLDPGAADPDPEPDPDPTASTADTNTPMLRRAAAFGRSANTFSAGSGWTQYGDVDTVLYGANVSVRGGAPAPTGYSFIEWRLDDGTLLTAGEGFTMPARNIVIYGTFGLNPYTVRYLIDGAQDGNVDTHSYGEVVTVRDDAPARENYTFSGWSLADGTPLAAASTFAMPAEHVTVYGVYTPNSYKVTYMVNGTVYGDVDTVLYGTYTQVRPNALEAGKTFSGWSTADATVAGGAFIMPGKDVVFTGTFTAVPDVVEPEDVTPTPIPSPEPTATPGSSASPAASPTPEPIYEAAEVMVMSPDPVPEREVEVGGKKYTITDDNVPLAGIGSRNMGDCPN